MPKISSKFIISAIIGIGLLIWLTYFLRENISNSLQYFITIAILSLSSGILATTISGKIIYNDGKIYATHGLAAFMVIFSSGLWFWFYNKNDSSSFNYSIFLENKDGDSPLKNSKINFRYGTANNPYDIDSKGGISIPSIAAKYKDGEAYIQLPSDGDWQFDNGTKKDTIKLREEKATLIIEPESSRCCLKGKIWFADRRNHILEGITIEAGESNVKTDVNGKFILLLPEKLRLENNIKIEAFIGKYKGSIYGNTASINDIRLELTNN
ncbi:hypothetical protein LV89_00695 [Arcicella aurantiaca]|uniref:Uncharacterized protein n=1 Tax=Arcicella aurantiaca TaxID=591202 RepID=A0A316EE67_9BACT|nr:hypothetical protein [Arcicella aurantiaca]PWK28491.1 hypothetical protein LV89_00695 [Arcicella aurantiaca]